MAGEIDLIVRGAQLVTPEGITETDLYVDAGKVVGLGRLDLPSKEVVSGGGLFLLPGMIDGHVHFMDPADTTREDFPTGSKAAAMAGVTTVIEHHHGGAVYNGKSLREKVAYLKNRSVVDFALGAHFSPRGIEETREAIEEGAAFIKVFTCTTHGIDAVENGAFLKAMNEFGAGGIPFLVHAEDESLTRVAELELQRSKREDGGVIPEARSRLAEQIAVTTVAHMAQVSGATLSIAHCSHAHVVDIVTSYRSQGARLWAEGCPQYFFLKEDEIKQFKGFRKFTPPARASSDSDLEAMWERLRNGSISYLASDHAPSTRAQKTKGSIWDVPFGLPGVDTTFPVMLDAVCRGLLSLPRLVELYALAPARLYGFYPRKGTLQVGSDADFVLVNLDGSRVLEDKDIISKAGWTPFAGRELRGRVVATYLRGRKIVENRKCLAPPGTGKFIPGRGRKK
jgi:dihydroorotase (multifunctional complex type)